MLVPLLACAESLPPLPRDVRAQGVEVAGEAGGARWTASAAGAVLAGGAVVADTVRVVRAEDAVAPLEIQAERSSWDLAARTARFEGAVRVTRGPVTLTCATLDVAYADAERIDRVVAVGAVEVTRGDRVATSERAELVARTGRITLTGAPSLAEGPNVLVGQRIELFLDDERATCAGGDGGPCRLVVQGTALR